MAAAEKRTRLRRCLSRWADAALGPVVRPLAAALGKSSLPPLRWLARRCTVRAFCRGVGSLCMLALCLWVFTLAFPLLGTAAPTAYARETPELVNTVSYEKDTVMTSLEVQWARGPVEVRLYNGDCIVVNEYAQKGLRTEEKGKVYLSSKNLVVNWSDSFLENLDAGVGGGLYKRLEVLIPRAQGKGLKYLRILAGESDISLSHCTASLSVRAENTAGTITLEGVSAPVAVLQSESGDIFCQGLLTEDLSLRTTGGHVWLQGCAVGTADVRSAQGPVHWRGTVREGTFATLSAPADLWFSAAPQRVDVVSSTGEVQVWLPRAAPENCLTLQSEEGAAVLHRW